MSWLEQFPVLTALDPDKQQLLVQQGTVLDVPKDTIVFGPGSKPDNLLLLLDGTVRVQQLSEKGREIVLYRIRSGESCVMTTACLLAGENYSAQGITESDVQVAAIPSKLFDQLISQSAQFRHFVFSAYSNRITELFRIIEEVAFQRVDIRLAAKLVDIAQGNHSIRITHQQLSAELGTAREVISRQLSEFQRKGWVAQSRGVVELTDPHALSQLSSS